MCEGTMTNITCILHLIGLSIKLELVPFTQLMQSYALSVNLSCLNKTSWRRKQNSMYEKFFRVCLFCGNLGHAIDECKGSKSPNKV